MQTYKEVVIEEIEPRQMELLIALLTMAGFEGFEEKENSLKAYIAEADFNEEELQQLAQQHHFTTAVYDQHERNWNVVWESNFPPVQVDNFVAVRADFHPSIKNVTHEIIITPKMSFGTGHHATTYMMIEKMKTIDFSNKSVFDFGTGTGILAILAEKLGATKIYAVDNDDWSIENAKENIQKNNCVRIIVDKRSDALSAQKFDVILANINKNVLLENMHALAHQLSDNGILIMSGLLKEDEKDILESARQQNLVHTSIDHKLQWIALVFRRD